MNRHTIAIAQINPVLGDLKRNLALHEKTAEEAIGRGAGLLVFPELSLTGYFLKDIVSSVALPITSPILGRLRDLSRRIDLVVGWWRSRPTLSSTTPPSTSQRAKSSTSTARSTCPPMASSTNNGILRKGVGSGHFARGSVDLRS